jgi:hypothetical protein
MLGYGWDVTKVSRGDPESSCATGCYGRAVWPAPSLTSLRQTGRSGLFWYDETLELRIRTGYGDVTIHRSTLPPTPED